MGSGRGSILSLEELERVYRSRHESFRRVAFALLRDQEDAREAVQEAFARAVSARGSFRGDGDLEAWLWRTLTNVCLDAKRRAARQNGSPPADERRTGESVDEEIRVAIARLPERQRLVLFLRYYADLPYEQIGKAVGVERGTVAATLHAAHLSLRQTMKEGKR